MLRADRFNRYIAPSVATGLLLVLGGTACGGDSLKTSPVALSRPYPGDPHAHGSDPLNWPEVIIAETQVPAGAKDVLVGFESPPGTDEWTESKPIDPSDAGKILLHIGRHAVEFRVQIQGKAGSEAVTAEPQVTFIGPEPYSEALKEPGIHEPSGWESGQTP